MVMVNDGFAVSWCVVQHECTWDDVIHDFFFFVWYQRTIVTGIGSIIADLYSVAVLP